MIAACWAFGETTPEEGLPRLADHGIEAIELWPGELRRFGTQRWRRALDRSGLRCVQLCPYFDFVHGPVGVEMGRSVLSEFLAVAAELDCRRLRTFTGPPWGSFRVGAAATTDEQWTTTVSGLIEFADLAASHNVELCLECHHDSLIEDVPGVQRLLRAVGRNNLTVNLQLPLARGTWEEAVDGLAPYTTHLHMHNWLGGFNVGGLTYLRDGVIDWESILRRLVALGRRPCLSLEHLSHDGIHDPWETIRRDGPWLHALRDRLWDGTDTLGRTYPHPSHNPV